MNVGAILLLILSLVIWLALVILHARKGPRPEIRPIPAFQRLSVEAGYAAESGGALHIALGDGGLYGSDSVLSLAALQVLSALADKAAAYKSPPTVTVGDPTLLPLAQDIIRRAYERNGLLDFYDPDAVRFVAPSSLGYAAGAGHTVVSERITANVIAGAVGAEASLIADAGQRRAIPQTVAVADGRALGALYPVTDSIAFGEEVYAAGAQMTGARRYLFGLLAQDILRAVLVLSIIVSAVLAFLTGW